MSTKKIHLTLTEKEAQALVMLAECSSNEWEDAAATLEGSPWHSSTAVAVAAGYRAIEKLNREIYKS